MKKSSHCARSWTYESVRTTKRTHEEVYQPLKNDQGLRYDQRIAAAPYNCRVSTSEE